MTDFLSNPVHQFTRFLDLYLVLESEKMHRFNRFYLLATLGFCYTCFWVSNYSVIPVKQLENMLIVPNFANVNHSIVMETNYISNYFYYLYALVTSVWSSDL
jgi:hypothetical protein